MLITDVSNEWALTLPGPTPGTPPRSSGLHVSDLVRAAAIDLRLFTPDDETAGFSQPSINRMCAGLAWEEWLERQYAGRVQFHPMELDVMGAKGSPDGFSLSPGGSLCVHEFKFTWKSANTPIARCWYWLSQIMCYLFGVGACTLGSGTYGAYLHTYHVMGDYRGSGPIYRVTYLEFTQRDIAENWALLETYRPQVMKEIEARGDTPANRNLKESDTQPTWTT